GHDARDHRRAHWLKTFGPWGPLVFAVVYALGVMTVVPAAPMTLVAAILYGFWAVPLVMSAAMVGALFAFFIARYVARERVAHFLHRDERLAAIDKAIGSDGWKVVTLLRISPLIPFNVQNYLFGLTRIRLGPYALSTFLGMIPGTLVFVYLGAAG